MSRTRKRVSPWFALLSAALLSATACGGKAFSAGEGGAGTGNAGAAGSGVSGSATAGSGVGGSGTAGSSVGGSPSAGASTGGAANGGTANAGSGGVNLATCVQNTDCVIEPTACCSCGSGPITDYTAINAKYQSQYHPECNAVDCAACPPIALNPNDPRLYYVPTCVSGVTVGDKVFHECRLVDIREQHTNITSCQVDSDCRLRGGSACCEACDVQPVAINAKQESALEALVCPTQAFGCPECATNYNGLEAQCLSGQCSVSFMPCTAQHPCPI